MNIAGVPRMPLCIVDVEVFDNGTFTVVWEQKRFPPNSKLTIHVIGGADGRPLLAEVELAEPWQQAATN